MFNTLYAKISAIFLLLILLLGSVLLFISLNSSLNYVCEASQKLNYNTAAQFARRCRPLLTDSIHYSGLKKDVMDFREMNPNAEVYMLNSDGTVIASSIPKDELQVSRIDMQPVLRFIDEDSYANLPIFGDDPQVKGRRKIFSAAKVTIGNTKIAYIYVTLASARYDLASEGILSSYILRSGSIAIIITLFFTALIGLFLFFILTKRIQRVTVAVKELTHGNYHKRIVALPGKDEVAQLATAFNSMAATIEKNIKEMKQNDQMRRDFTANISHDLRSPLTSIQGCLETIQIKNKDLNASKKDELIDVSLKNVMHLSQLVSHLFELSKLDAKQIQPQKESFSLTELVQDVVLKFQPLAEERGIHLEADLSVRVPHVWGDIGMIERGLSNLIDNALKYSPEKGTVSIQLSKQTDSVLVRVCDNGPGISEEDLPHIFNRFYTVDKSRTKGRQGSGLGLAIAQKIAAAHGSKIEVESRRNEGTTFSFQLTTVT